MEKRRLIPDPVLMVISILVLTAFQLYWIKDNYNREKHSLDIRANMAFQDAVRRAQAVALKLKDPSADSSHNEKMKITVDSDPYDDRSYTKMLDNPDIVMMTNVIRDRLHDTTNDLNLKFRTRSLDVHDSLRKSNDSTHRRIMKDMFVQANGNNRFFKILYAVDSLQDSLRLVNIRSEYYKKLAEQSIAVPFSISRTEMDTTNDTGLGSVTVGFAHPITYRLRLENTFSYLIKRIAVPILFSLFLVGITIVSFVFLYKNLLRQKRLADVKNEFISNITHELKTPIATVGVAIEALRSFNALQDPAKTKEYLDISANELQRLGLLVDKVLKLSMFENNAVEIRYDIVDLVDIVNEVISSMRLQIEKLHAQVSITSKGDTKIEADPLHLLSVVFNLVDNALKYSSDNLRIDIDISEQGTSVAIKVADNGIGIAPEFRKKIFEKFFRVPHGNTHNAKGYGLGLSYVAQVVNKHHGEIDVESELGQGTSITIIFPRNQA